VDIFIKFEKSTSEEKFENISKKIGFESLKKYSPYVRYSEHPYVEARIKDTKINVVPFYDVKIGEWKSAADRSPFHTKFMKKSLTVKMRNEVRILKTFLKSNGIYGAEIAKQGFSGYVSEVLILNFKSFENLIKSISNIKENQIIGKTTKKFETLIVIIDPIDSNRNLAAAISDENIGKFILISRAFKEKPRLELFKNKKLKVSKKYWDNLLVVKFDFKSRSPDVIWGQIKRATSSLVIQLELGGFTVLRSKSYTDQVREAYLLFFLKSTKISNIYSKNGPEFFRESGSKSFISKNLKNTELMWIGTNGKIISLEKRKHTDAVKFMSEFLKKNLQTGMPKGLLADFKRGFRVSIGNKNLSKSIKEEAGELISTDGALLYFN
jgi:tRNA nucleotidyltransferase (CCA-adding enzyme)